MPSGRVVVKGFQQGISRIPENISAANRVERIAVFAVEISFERDDSAGNENGVGGYGFKVDGVDHSRVGRIPFLRGISRVNPATIARVQFLCAAIHGAPPPAVESRKRDAPPAQPVVSNRFSCLYAHDHRGILFDLADLTKLDVSRETGHERGAEAGAAEVPGAETREKEKQHATQNDGSRRHAESRKTKRAIQSSIALRVHMKDGRNGADGSAAQFHSNESGNTEQEEDQKQNQEGGIHGENGRGEKTGKGKHREKQGIHWEECQVSDHAPGCGAVRKLGGAPVPPAKALVEHY